MCGSDPRLRSARPAWFSAVATSPYRRPALIVTAAFGVSTSIRRGRPATETRSPGESARRLNECPVPRARTRLLRATRCCSSGTDAGRWKRSAPNVTLPAQFVRFPVNSLLPSRPKPDRPKLTGQARCRTGRGRRRSWFSKRDTATHWPAAPGRREASGQLQTADSFVRRALPWDLEPADVLRLVRDDAHPVALVGAWAAGGAMIGSEPHLTRSPPQCLGDVLDSPSPGAARGARALDGDSAPWPEPSGESADAAFGGGWIGYLGYGLAGDLMDMPPAPGGPRQLPAWWFGFYDHVLRQDGTSGRRFFEALWTPGREDIWPAGRRSCSCAGAGGPRRPGRSRARAAGRRSRAGPGRSAASLSTRPRMGPRT